MLVGSWLRLPANDERHQQLADPVPSKSSAIVPRDRVLSSRGSTVPFTIPLTDPSTPRKLPSPSGD
ncbi:MAG TPA: hypothetical protein VHF51_03260 [Solirubrobacteraceae bacterium]|nr:hypothetical protein [Solirubrobacteraceae bacterium]